MCHITLKFTYKIYWWQFYSDFGKSNIWVTLSLSKMSPKNGGTQFGLICYFSITKTTYTSYSYLLFDYDEYHVPKHWKISLISSAFTEGCPSTATFKLHVCSPSTTLDIFLTQQALRLNSHFQKTNSEARDAVYRQVIRTLARKLNCISYLHIW